MPRLFPVPVEYLFLLMHAAYPALAHLLILADLIFGELSVLAEYEIEAHPEDGQSYQNKGQEEHLHKLEDELRTDRLVVVNLVDDVGEGLGHGEDLDLAGIDGRIGSERNGIRHVHFLEFRAVDIVICRA